MRPPGMRSRLALAALLLGAIPGPGAVARAADQTPLTSFLHDPRLQQQIINIAAQSAVVVKGPACPGTSYRVALNPMLARPMRVDDTGTPVDGALIYPVQAEGCGQVRILNVQVTVQPDRTAAVTPLLPGTTHATPSLQREAVPFAFGALGAAGIDPGCKINYIADTTYLGPDLTSPAVLGRPAPWRERWTLIHCQQRYTVPMLFTPTQTGTAIHGEISEVTVEDLPAPAN